jgi:transposase InsO family protein
MGVSRSSFYAEPAGRPADAVIVAEIRDITDEFEGYGYRRVDAELRHRGFGYAVGRSIDARLATKALRNAIALRRPMPGCVFHTDRGSQYASELHRDILAVHGFFGSMSRRGNPYDNAQAESFMKTLKVEDAYLMEYETFEDVAIGVPRFT